MNPNQYRQELEHKYECIFLQPTSVSSGSLVDVAVTIHRVSRDIH